MDPIRKIPKKFTKKFGNKFINRQYFHRKTGLNTRYLTDSYIIFTLKMESVFKNTIFGLKMIENDSKKWFRKNLFEIPPCGRLFFLTSKKCPKLQIQ